MLKSLIDVRYVTSESLLAIFKNLFEMTNVKILEEALLHTFDDFLSKLETGFYQDLQENKKVNKFMDKFLNLLNKVLVNKSNFELMKNLIEFSFIFILLSHSGRLSSISNFLSGSTNSNLLQEGSLTNYFRLLLSTNLRENEFHVSFRFLLDYLKNMNDFPKVIEVWNVLIDSSVQEKLKNVSLKNFQLLIFSFSKFLLENYFILKYIKQIFDCSFFDNLLKFPSNKKFKFVSSLIETLTAKLKSTNEERELVSSYSSDLISMFSSEGGLSPQSYKNFFTFLFNNLDENEKLNFVENLCRSKQADEEEEDNFEEESSEEVLYKISALKQLMVGGEANLSKSLKNKIVGFFLKLYIDGDFSGNVELDQTVEDRMLLVIFSLIRVPKDEEEKLEEELNKNSNKKNKKGNSQSTQNQESLMDETKPIKDSKMIKILLQVHNLLQSLVNSKEIEEIEMENYKVKFIINIIN